MNKWIFIIAVVSGIYYFGFKPEQSQDLNEYVSHNKIIMYSLTTCGYCKQKREILNFENIPFTEYFIDTDSRRLNELNQKLAEAGYEPRRYGTPIMDVYGTMLPNNPSLSKIKKYMN